MRKALVFIDYDMLIRHFIMSGVFAELEKEYEITFVFHKDSTVEKQGIYNNIEKLDLTRKVYFEVPRKRMGAWYKLNVATILHNQRGTPNYKPRKERITAMNGWLRSQYYAFLAQPGLYDMFRRRYLKQMGVLESLLSFVGDQRPDIVIHPSVLTGFFIQELIPVCRQLDVPFVALMNSWDNPSGKAVVSGWPDRLVVWGEQTRRHAVKYMALPEDRVLDFGAAQFQVYRRPVNESDEELRRMFGVPDDKPILLYAGVSKSVNETRHLKLLDDGIENGSIPPCHVIYRPHPWRGVLVKGERSFFDMNFRHITIDPSMEDFYRKVVNGGFKGFYLADYNVTSKLLKLTIATIAPLSTIMLESILFGNPVLMFFPQTELDAKFGKFNRITGRMAHYAEFWDCPGINRCLDTSELPAAVTRLLAQAEDNLISQGLKRHAEYFVVMDGPTYGERLAALANELIDQRAATTGSGQARNGGTA